MIITSNPDVKDVEQLDIVVNFCAAVPDDFPPAYSDSKPNSTPKSQPPRAQLPMPPLPLPTSSPTSASGPSAPSNVKPTNFLSLSLDNSTIKGTYVIDPAISIPPLLLPPLAPDETEATRKNAFLHTNNGTIDVDLFVVGSGGEDAKPKGKVHMLLKSSSGRINARLHASAPVRPPISLSAHSSNGSINIRVPRSFRGPVTVRTQYGSLKFAGELGAAVTTLNEVNGTHRAFIGDFSDWVGGRGVHGDNKGVGEDAWPGDAISVETSNGSVRFQFDTPDSEMRALGEGKGEGFFGRLLRY
ncbi:hypothetical protein DFH07DRAFT_826354 [Mycena maculata]|uniref:DUF7330 domain-containing protein n=1 Tax=Mycena maculata TaxID=230809 RepID=A0AAD7N8N3_9AGAR|nr:hypothetical protein DFH07DRAFT_826354 [Mycena maculata]